MKRLIWTLVICGCAILLALPGLRVNDDPIASLLAKDPIRAQLFDRLQASSVFKNRLFVATNRLSPDELQELIRQLSEAGYQRDSLLDLGALQSLEISEWVALLPAEELQKKFSSEGIARRTADVLAISYLAGGSGLLGPVESDPFDIKSSLMRRYFPQQQPADGHTILTFTGPTTTNFERVEVAYDTLLSYGERIGFVGGDLFAFENYRAIKADISFCLWLSIPLNLLLFMAFTRHWRLLFFLLVGSVVSYVTGLIAIRLAFSEIYTLVFAFTSTFVGFNNEYLIHLSGIDPKRFKIAALSLGSAIGTTVIGFLVLLFSDSIIIRQMAVVSLGGMLGFIGFLLYFRDYLAAVAFRTWNPPSVRLNWYSLLALWIALLGALWGIGLPPIATQIDDFRYSSGILEKRHADFQSKTPNFAASNIYAFPVGDALVDGFNAVRPMLSLNTVHPLDHFPTMDEQDQSVRIFNAHYQKAANDLAENLSQHGIELASRTSASATAKSPESFLNSLNQLSPIPWYAEVEGRKFLYLQVSDGSELLNTNASSAMPMGPRHYYNMLLTGMSEQMGMLFVWGVLAMIAFLLPVQRSIGKVLYVFLPLLAAALAFAIYIQQSGASLNIIHFMGFALVIALAVDYSAVAVSTDFSPQDVSKVILTGLATIASFGVLALAQHPVLRDLGFTVALGAAVALGFTVFLRYQPQTERQL